MIGLAATLRVALHQFADGRASGLPLGLVAEDRGVLAEPVDLGHRGHDHVVGQLAVAACVDLTRHEVAADGIERRAPAAPAQFVAFAQGLEPFVVADGVTVMLAHVPAQVHAQARQVETVRAAVVVDREVADRAGRQLGGGPRRVAVRKPTTAAEGCVVANGGRAALEATESDHAANTPSRMARRMAVSMMGSAPVRWTCQASGVYRPAGRRATRVRPLAPRPAIASARAASRRSGVSGRTAPPPRTACSATPRRSNSGRPRAMTISSFVAAGSIPLVSSAGAGPDDGGSSAERMRRRRVRSNVDHMRWATSYNGVMAESDEHRPPPARGPFPIG